MRFFLMLETRRKGKYAFNKDRVLKEVSNPSRWSDAPFKLQE